MATVEAEKTTTADAVPQVSSAYLLHTTLQVVSRCHHTAQYFDSEMAFISLRGPCIPNPSAHIGVTILKHRFVFCDPVTAVASHIVKYGY